jgi:hypothetical protein
MGGARLFKFRIQMSDGGRSIMKPSAWFCPKWERLRTHRILPFL